MGPCPRAVPALELPVLHVNTALCLRQVLGLSKERESLCRKPSYGENGVQVSAVSGFFPVGLHKIRKGILAAPFSSQMVNSDKQNQRSV